MKKGRTIVNARNDAKGNIKDILLKGETTYIPLAKAVPRIKNGEIKAVVVRPKDAKVHIRTPPDSRTKNNLDELAKKN